MESTHFIQQGKARMVDVNSKPDTRRIAMAQGTIRMSPGTIDKINNMGISKGDVLSVAQIAGIIGAKKTNELIPMCHPLMPTEGIFTRVLTDGKILVGDSIEICETERRN